MNKRFIPLLLLVTYSAILIKVMVFKDIPTIHIGHMMFNFGGTDANGQANLIPFRTIMPYLYGYKGQVIASVNLIGNIVVLIPFGFLLPFVSRKITWPQSLIVAILAGLVIEGLQVILNVGIFDIDDIILNGLGVMIGYWISLLFVKS